MATPGNQGKRPFLISFSGVDGSGKSTQIENVHSVLDRYGLSHTLLTFWDNVVVGVRYREGFVHKVYKSEQGIGAPGKPVNRRDKNMRGWHLTLARHGLYLADALNLGRVIRRAARGGPDVIIMDRYIYDELANLPLRSAFTRAFIQGIQAVVPQPDVAYLLDADPEKAYARKPEYPVDFMKKCRSAYFDLAHQLGSMSIIPPLELGPAKLEVEQVLLNCLRRHQLIDAGTGSRLDNAPAA